MNLTKEQFEDLAYQAIIVKVQEIYNIGYFQSPIGFAEEIVELISEVVYPNKEVK
jgi:hypothetical protein